ncbi:MAG: RNA polymerase sigma factor [bacterium]
MKNCDQKTDEQLVSLTLQDEDWYLCLMNRYEDKLIRYIKRISSATDEDAEDILQEVFIKAYQNLNDFDQGLKYSSWIYRITHNQVISQFRKVQARPQLIGSEDSEIILNLIADDSNHDVKEKIDNSLRSEKIKLALTKLDNKYQEVLVLKYLEDYNYKEISDILRKPEGTISTLISRAKKKLKDIILKEGKEQYE